MTEQDAIKDMEISCKCLRDAINNENILNGYILKPLDNEAVDPNIVVTHFAPFYKPYS